MRLDEFERLYDLLSELKQRFPADQVWGELEHEIASYYEGTSKDRTDKLVPPIDPDEWESWSGADCQELYTGEIIKGAVFYPKPIMLGASCSVNGAVYSGVQVSTRPRAAISGDIVSRKSILWQGHMVRSMVAPEIHIDRASLSVTGSIICRVLRVTPKGYLSGSIAGHLLVSEAIVDSEGGQLDGALAIGDDSKIGGIHVPCGILCGARVKVQHLCAKGDVGLGEENQVVVLKAGHISIGSQSQVGQIHARESLEIGDDCRVHSAIVGGKINVGSGARLMGGILASLSGEILADKPWWEQHRDYYYTGKLAALVQAAAVGHPHTGNGHEPPTFEQHAAAAGRPRSYDRGELPAFEAINAAESNNDGITGSAVLRFLPHEWYWKLQSMVPDGALPGWLGSLVPAVPPQL